MASPPRNALLPPRDVEDLEALLHHVSDQIAIWDNGLRLIYANPAVMAWRGDRLADARGLQLVDFVGPDVADHLAPYFDAARAEGRVQYTRVLKAPDEHQRTFAVSVSACVIAGRLAGYVMHGIDRTAVVGARAVQRQSVARALLLAERDRVAADLGDGIAAQLRTMAGELQGVDPTEATQRLIDATLDGLADSISQIRDAIKRLLEPVEPSVAAPLPHVPQGGPQQTWNPELNSASDRSDRAITWTMNEALAFIDQLPGITAWDTDQTNVFANRLAVWGVGRDSRADMIGRGRVELFGPEVAARSQPYAEAAAHGEPQRYDSNFVDGEGVPRSIHFVYDPVYRDGQPIGMIATLNDVEASESSGSVSRFETLTADRQRIAEDLHDHVIQLLYAAGIALDNSVEGARQTSLLEHGIQCITAAIDALQTSVHALPADAVDDLAESLQRTVHRAEPTLGLAPRVDIIGDLRRITPGVATELLAVLTEALSNVARHAAATDVHITLSNGADTAWLRVADNGVGIGDPTRSSGLTNMSNRAERLSGTFRYLPNAPHGTVIDWRVPL